jgi:hypothetical protein
VNDVKPYPILAFVAALMMMAVPAFAAGGDNYDWTTSGDGSKGILFVNYSIPSDARDGSWSVSTTTSHTTHIDNYTSVQLGDCWTQPVLQFAIVSDTGQSYWGNTIRCWDGSWHELIRHGGADSIESGSGDGGTPTEAYDDDWDTGTTCLSNSAHNGCNWQDYDGSYNAQINEEAMFWEFYSIEPSDVSMSISSPYDGSPSSFNVTWTTDDDAIDYSWIVGIDISNQSMTIEGNVSFYSTIIPIGTYDIFACANTTHGATTCTDMISYSVLPPPPPPTAAQVFKPIILLVVAAAICIFVYNRLKEGDLEVKAMISLLIGTAIAISALIVIGVMIP